jgi:CRISPR-associated endoribonuclease Cas6
MRFRLELQPTGTRKILPVNYQYELSSWIYKTIHLGNPEFAGWLHNHGYMDGKKQFKYFTFSNLIVDKLKISGDRLELISDNCFFEVSFFLESAVEPFILGLFRNQEFTLGDQISKIHFHISGIEKLPEPVWNETMNFSTQSPIVISFQQENSRTASYLAPDHPDFKHLFIKNLHQKLYTFSIQKQEPFPLNNYAPDPGALQVSRIKSKLIKIKAGTPQQSLIKGYLFDFTLTAPVDFMKVGYYAGFGEKGSLGFGSCKVF